MFSKHFEYIKNNFFNYIYYFLEKNNICIFGGCVRDMLLNIIPNDIDCIMTEKQLSIFISFLHKNNILFLYDNYDNNDYIPMNDNKKIIKSLNIIKIYCNFKLSKNKLYKIFLSYIKKETIDYMIENNYFESILNEINEDISKYCIKLDIFTYNNKYSLYEAINIITENVDYYCNSVSKIGSLYYISNNIIEKFIKNQKYMEYKLKYENIINEIFDQIKTKKAIPISFPDIHRIKKMENKNWIVF